jgi:hypothetical protein
VRRVVSELNKRKERYEYHAYVSHSSEGLDVGFMGFNVCGSLVDTNISEELISSIFRTEDQV